MDLDEFEGLEEDEFEEEEANSEDDSNNDDISLVSTDFDSDSSDEDFDQCTCSNCKILKDKPEFQFVKPDSDDVDIFKFDVYHITNHVFNLFKDLDLPTSLKFMPELLRKLREKMKYGLQEELGSLLHFPGHGYLPNTVQIQIVEILLQLSLYYPDADMIYFEDNSDQIKDDLYMVYFL